VGAIGAISCSQFRQIEVGATTSAGPFDLITLAFAWSFPAISAITSPMGADTRTSVFSSVSTE